MVMVMEGGEVCWGEFLSWRNLERFCLWSQNQQSHQQTEATAGFSASNRPRIRLEILSDCSLKAQHGGVNRSWLPVHDSCELSFLSQSNACDIFSECDGNSANKAESMHFPVTLLIYATRSRTWPRYSDQV